MAVRLECDRVGCDAAVEVPAVEFASGTGDAYIGVWVPRRESEADESDDAYGWSVDVAGVDHVLHCPDHADREEA